MRFCGKKAWLDARPCARLRPMKRFVLASIVLVAGSAVYGQPDPEAAARALLQAAG